MVRQLKGSETVTTPEDFLKFDYVEIKDLAKAFLTLISAVLVFSITFSDKVADFPKADRIVRGLLVTGWLSFTIAIALCGVAICVNFLAGLTATYENIVFGFPDHYVDFGPRGYWVLSGFAQLLMFLSGTTFVMGLICLVASAMRSTITRKPPTDFS